MPLCINGMQATINGVQALQIYCYEHALPIIIGVQAMLAGGSSV